MSLSASAGRIVIRNAASEIVFDTDERLFIASDFMSGSVVRPARSVFYQRIGSGVEQWFPIDITESVDLGAVHASAEAVVGSFKVTGNLAVPGGGSQAQAANGVRNYGWFSAGGTYAHALLPRWSFVSSAWGLAPHGLFSLYTFRVSGGRLYLDERTQGNPGFIAAPTTGSISLSQEEITIDYKLYAGTYV